MFFPMFERICVSSGFRFASCAALVKWEDYYVAPCRNISDRALGLAFQCFQ